MLSGSSEQRLTLFPLLVFEELHAFESSSTANQLVGELGFVWLLVFSIDLLMSVSAVVCMRCQYIVDLGMGEVESVLTEPAHC